ncbi:MAG: hypothetical protein LRZ99_01940 [Desulfotomaculum sp.]|nr:hypothetical protein [Desulfotomaculum sp.]MCL0081379.1 hypothetical protein [Peptococcaceae bacterium]
MKNISDKKINILRVYAHENTVEEVKVFCNDMFEKGYDQYLANIEQKKQQIEKLSEEVKQDERSRKQSKEQYK